MSPDCAAVAVPLPAHLESVVSIESSVSPEEAGRREWPVVVVGAGPAGSIAAREVARRGEQVLLVDRSAFPRSKVCGCCLNGSALATLRAVGLGEIPMRLGAVPLHQVRLATGGRQATVPLAGGVALSRSALDAALVREAIAAGATFLAPATVNRIRSSNSHAVELDVRPGAGPEVTIRARIVIAADGLAGRVTSSGSVKATSRIGAGAILCDGPCEFTAGIIFMAVGRGGYVGLVRLEDGRLDVAAAFDTGLVRASGGPGLAAVEVLRASGFPDIDGLAGAPWRGTPRLTRVRPQVAGARRLTVGDAAGYVEPFTGEGMAWALASGVAAAPVAIRGAAAWTDSLAREWTATHARLVRSRQGVCRVAAAVLRSPPLCGLAVRLLAIAPALSRPVVALLNRPARFAPRFHS
jgi:flavin-dependent dehydrogenase